MSNPKPHWNLIFAGVPLVLTFVNALATTQYECQNRETSAVDLTFASLSPRVLIANVKSKTALESDICWCPFGSDIRKRARHTTIRMSEPGHQLTRRNCRFGPRLGFAAHRYRLDRSQHLPLAPLKRNVRFVQLQCFRQPPHHGQILAKAPVNGALKFCAMYEILVGKVRALQRPIRSPPAAPAL
jgi:hypothetical protein